MGLNRNFTASIQAKGRAGMTLIELLIVVAMIGITSAVALSAYSTMSSLTDTHSYARQAAAYLQDARMDAINSGRDVIIESSDQLDRLRFSRDENGNGTIDTGDVARADMTLPGGVLISRKVGPILINNRGYLVDIARQPMSLNITFCLKNTDSPTTCLTGEKMARLSITPAGIPSLTYGAYTGD